jgi:hypothetical protein
VSGTAALPISFLASDFEPMARIAEAGGPMKVMPLAAQASAEIGVFGQEAVAGMHGLGAGAFGGIDDSVGDQIGLARRGRAEQHGLVGEADVAGVGIGLGIDGDGADAHAAGGLDDPTGDFAAVCDPRGSC